MCVFWTGVKCVSVCVLVSVDSSDAGRTDLSVKAPAQVIGPDRVHFPANQSSAQGTPEPASRWGQETEGEAKQGMLDTCNPHVLLIVKTKTHTHRHTHTQTNMP